MVALGFLNGSNAPTEEAKQALPTDLDPPRPEVMEKTVLTFIMPQVTAKIPTLFVWVTAA